MNSTRRLTLIGLLSAIAFVLMVFASFPIIPGVSFLKVDLSFIPVFIGALLLDLKAGYWIIIIRSVLKLLLNNSGVNDYIGLPMNMIAFAVLLTILYFFIKKETVLTAVVGLVLGTVMLTVMMVLLNYVYAIPLYTKFANFNIQQIFGISKYLISMVIPFNLVQGVILSGLSYLIFVPMRRFIKHTNPAFS
ncbi:ECF transporter S component [Weissella soli]|uniref:ECF transporter S component n=1 Tax=Weissella soli TaxID=155866 RepID=UPI0011BB9AD1|nr:ECF transporter S component [Weissella soli]QEA34940.1 ECF transporter S component [Weissella soli]